MSTNDSGEVVTPQENNETEVTEETTETTEESKPTEGEKKEERPQRTPEEELAFHERRAKQLRKKLGTDSEPKKTKKSDELDFGQLAFYNSKSDTVKIESEEDIDFLKTTIEETGKSQQAILNSSWFKKELSERKEAQSVAKATPGRTKGATQPASTKVEYWIERNELPSDPALRAKVVDAKYELARNGRKF